MVWGHWDVLWIKLSDEECVAVLQQLQNGNRFNISSKAPLDSSFLFICYAKDYMHTGYSVQLTNDSRRKLIKEIRDLIFNKP